MKYSRTVLRASEAAGDGDLARFIAESPLDRSHIHAFLARLATGLPPGTRVLDAGAGDSPYRPLFVRCQYMTSDWAESLHPGARSADVIAPLGQLPLEARSLDVIVNTQVLEHVADPAKVLADFHRLLVPGGELWLSVPLVWELHEEPHDYFRYTSYGLTALLREAGFEALETVPIGGYFATVGQLLRNCGAITGLDRRGLAGRGVTLVMSRAGWLARLDGLDRRRALPLGWCCRARRQV
jgi:SAM-dependent methyltransferase